MTLTENGVLRGCIGYILPQEALYQAVVDNARNAATRDPRFQPVRPDEVNKIKIEISVLTEPQPLSFNSPEDLLNKLEPGEDGVVLQIGPRQATYLPQVWEQLPDKVQFLNNLARKSRLCAGRLARQECQRLHLPRRGVRGAGVMFHVRPEADHAGGQARTAARPVGRRRRWVFRA